VNYTIIRIKEIKLENETGKPIDYEDFDEMVSVLLEESDKNLVQKFYVRMLSVAAFKRMLVEKQSIYLRSCIVIKYYDESAIRKHVLECLKSCQSMPVQKTFSCLSHYMFCESEMLE
jgi:hypothetical protein